MIIFMGNLGYLRGINGCLGQHVRYAYRHIYCSPAAQSASLSQLVALIEKENPDICCFVEIEKSLSEATLYPRLEKILMQHYPYFDIENKYGETSYLRHLPLSRSKSNGFLSKTPVAHEKIYFRSGTKRLIYKLQINPNLTLFFAHFSLKQKTRILQIEQFREIIHSTPGEIILLGDFNIHSGFKELAPLLDAGRLILMSQENQPTFRFHRTRLPLDICLCSHHIAAHAELRIIPQPYSDHDGLLLNISE